MAINTSLFTRCVPIPVAYSASNETNFVLPLIWNGSNGNVPAEMYNAGTLSPKSNGSDIRFSSDISGQTELPFEIVTFTPNATTINARMLIYVKVPNFSGLTIYGWWKNASATAYAVTDPYGRNACWSNGYVGIFHLNETSGTTAYNSVGGNDGTYVGTPPSPLVVDTIFGPVHNFANANNNYITLGSGAPWDITGLLAITALVQNTSWTANWQAIVAKGDAAYRLHRHGGDNYPALDRTLNGGGYVDVTNTNVFSGLTLVKGIYNPSSGTHVYVNGVDGGLDTTLTATASTSDVLCIGRNSVDITRDWNGYIGHVRISNVARTATWPAAEYNSIVNFATFVTPGTPRYSPAWLASHVVGEGINEGVGCGIM